MDEVIYLLKTENTENAIGDPIKKLKKIKRLSQKLEIRQSEFYQASAVGLKPEMKFLIWKFEYSGEMFLEYKNRNYKIIKTYERRSEEKIELTVVSVTNKEVMAYGTTEANKNN